MYVHIYIISRNNCILSVITTVAYGVALILIRLGYLRVLFSGGGQFNPPSYFKNTYLISI